MQQVRRLATIVLFSSRALSAQWDMGSAVAILKVEGRWPSSIDATGHHIVVPIGSYLNLTFDSGANPAQGIILLTSAANPNGVDRIPTPFRGGSIDVGNGSVPAIQIVADGIAETANPTIDPFFRTSFGYQPPFRSGLPTVPSQLEIGDLVPASACGSRIARQAIIAERTNPPFNVGNTQCADTNFSNTFATILQLVQTGDDGCVRVQLRTTTLSRSAVNSQRQRFSWPPQTAEWSHFFASDSPSQRRNGSPSLPSYLRTDKATYDAHQFLDYTNDIKIAD